MFSNAILNRPSLTFKLQDSNIDIRLPYLTFCIPFSSMFLCSFQNFGSNALSY